MRDGQPLGRQRQILDVAVLHWTRNRTMAVIVNLNSKSDRYQRERPVAPGGNGTAEIILLPCVRREAIPEQTKKRPVLKRQA
ncbi:hypothetical protein [Aurantimonas coralicida]|uniref:hypothetical protein n=1 Tax=Aurantimonas coralicida TaxID=182270 RepID=UPI0023A01D85|nr:hypothetical protein [Aurantimonas coralicida]MDE0924498.1 hypothetical protein [Aurantimonas coralicida]